MQTVENIAEAMAEKVRERMAQRAVRILNKLRELDPDAMRKLVLFEVQGNGALAAHDNVPSDGRISILSLLNVMIGIRANGWGRVSAVFEVKCLEHGVQGEGVVGEQCRVTGLGEGFSTLRCNQVLQEGALLRFEHVTAEMAQQWERQRAATEKKDG